MARPKKNIPNPQMEGDQDISQTSTKQVKKYVETPLMKQYYDIKAVHPDAILLFRVGDFYETFGDDAIRTSSILGITLTRRANGAAQSVELAGFPHHAVETYLPKLVRAGARVAICEQLEDPKSVKGLVKRGVVELITPGVALGETTNPARENRFLASVYFGAKSTGVAFLDASTGEFYCSEGTDAYVDKLLASFSPKEVLFQRGFELRFIKTFGDKHYTYKLDEWVYSVESCREKLCVQFKTRSLRGFGVDRMSAAISAAGAILSYLDFTEHKKMSHINSISRIDEDEYVWIDKFTIRNLELFSRSDGESKRLGFAEVIDRTCSPMGGRMLKRWVSMPIRNIEKINRRLDIVSTLTMDRDLAAEVEEYITSCGDIERIVGRVASGKITPRELVQLRRSLGAIAKIKESLSRSESSILREEGERLNALESLHRRLADELFVDPPTNLAKGGVIANNVSAELDDLRRIALHGKEVLMKIVNEESQSSGIPLKVGYNGVFGYFVEAKSIYKEKAPEYWTLRQTLATSLRYTFEDLREYEEKIVGAEQRVIEIEQRIFNGLVELTSRSLSELRSNAALVARLDVLQSFARMACEGRYTRPHLNDSKKLEISQGRHPVIESLLPVGEKYIPNDVSLDDEHQQIMLITGPNMSGKSALLRQTALIVLMAQMGSFVPAASAEIGVVDKIFTRVGASDNISQGESTFMVEMHESASILNNISDRSLVLLDEIGRGTSTYDGISIAWAIVEYLHNHPRAKAKTLFATHYHELGEMEEICERVKNYHVTVKELGGSVAFVRTLSRGCSERSFGIHVARMAGMPQSVVDRAGEILLSLEHSYRCGGLGAENGDEDELRPLSPSVTKAANSAGGGGAIQLQMFQLDDPVLLEIRNQLIDLDPNNLTPLEALNKLAQIKKLSGL